MADCRILLAGLLPLVSGPLRELLAAQPGLAVRVTDRLPTRDELAAPRSLDADIVVVPEVHPDDGPGSEVRILAGLPAISLVIIGGSGAGTVVDLHPRTRAVPDVGLRDLLDVVEDHWRRQRTAG